MALTTAAMAATATVVSSMYLDARLLLRNDATSGALGSMSNKAVNFMTERSQTNTLTIFADIERHAKNPDMSNKPCLIFEGRTWTYRQFWEDVTRVGLYLIEELQIQRGEMVALDGGNSPEYMMLWFGIEAIGAVPAFINCNLTANPLLHCVKVCGARFILTDRDIGKLVADHKEELEKMGCGIVWYNRDSIRELKAFDGTEVPKSRTKDLKLDESACLIYTSGTTGNPKGANLVRGKCITTPLTISEYLGLKPGDRMFTCLPLYHAAAQGLCVSPSFFAGSAVVLNRKFSHKTFWPAVRESKANILQYVGELCRYLVNAPPNKLDKEHCVRMAWGNGMRPDVWENFRQRFNIPVINELYAATDGLGSSFNYNMGDFGRYAVGKRGAMWKLLNGSREKRIKIDVVTQEIVRDSNGFAIECADGEPGEAVHLLDPAKEKIMLAGYYKDENATEKRKIRDLFKKGDKWFRSGDLMRQDPDGCVYFVDRLGDTFRWKSENVSTSEVGDVLGHFDQIAEANVYGVQVPNADGRCGCGAIVMTEGTNEDKFDFDALAKHCISTLPRYAVPVFIRIVKELNYTGTMKVQKGKLREEGIDVNKVGADSSSHDSMYWMPPGKSVYVPFGKKDLEDLKGGQVKL